MSNQDPGENTLPKLGGPTPPSLGSTGTPALGGPGLGGPSLSTPASSKPQQDVKIPGSVEIKKKKLKINIFELTRQWKVILRRTQRSLQTMMSYEFKTKVSITVVNKIIRDLIENMFEGQLEYLNTKIKEVTTGKDKLSIELMKSDPNGRASTQVFHTLIEIIEEELQGFREDKPDIMEPLAETFKRHRDARTEPRMCLWIIIFTGLQLKLIRDKVPEAFDIVLDVMIRYRPAIKRTLGVYLYFCYHLINEMNPYQYEICDQKLTIGPTMTGYNMASWIKYRYGTNSQAYMEYDRFVNYFLRGFGRIPSNAPRGDKSPRMVYQNWLKRTLESLETSLRNSPLLVENARGDTLEGMIIGLKDELSDELLKREYDVDGKLMNYPAGGEESVQLLDWMFETAFNRYTTTNIAAHGETRLNLNMFEFIESTTSWVNEYGERIVMDWLEEQDEEEDLGELAEQPDFTG
ncbi:MAG: hypothetical protein GPJ54_06435 [Candidatus Heimdallarchaeota archaeon]|nr:hypothetical protein [Candidatus Heimdallarchaeota archaeon]